MKKKLKHQKEPEPLDIRFLALMLVCLLALGVVYYMKQHRRPVSHGTVTDAELTVRTQEEPAATDGDLVVEVPELTASGSDIRKN